MADGTDTLLTAPITFHVRPVPIPGFLRPVYRLSLLTLVVERCHANRATMLQLQVLNWAIRNPDTRGRFLKYIHGTLRPNDIVVRFDPSLSRAVDFALGEGILAKPPAPKNDASTPESVPLELTKRGFELAETLRSKEFADVFIVEKEFLGAIGTKVSRTAINRLFVRD